MGKTDNSRSDNGLDQMKKPVVISKISEERAWLFHQQTELACNGKV